MLPAVDDVHGNAADAGLDCTLGLISCPLTLTEVIEKRVWSQIRVLGRGNCGTLGQKGLMNSKHVGVGISLGVCFGAALGTALHNLGWSSSAVGVGIALGVSLGTVASSRFVFGGRSDAALARKSAVSEKPLPHPLGL